MYSFGFVTTPNADLYWDLIARRRGWWMGKRQFKPTPKSVDVDERDGILVGDIKSSSSRRERSELNLL